jgi:chromosome segregation ATPase
MSNDTTQNLPNSPSFEERVFARFDALDARFERMEERQKNMEERQERMEARFERMDERQERMEARFERMEARVEKMDDRQERTEARLERIETRLDGIDQRLEVLENKAYDTKPIWERALGEILELREDVRTLNRKFKVITHDSITLRAEQSRLEDRMDKLDAERA